MSIDHNEISFIEIFPPVGIARIGDSDKYFLAPEVPGVTEPPTTDKNFRDENHKIRRQAVRFRVYAFRANGTVLAEINNETKDGNNSYSLTWTVHVANKKASYKLFHGRQRPDTTRLRNPDVDPMPQELAVPGKEAERDAFTDTRLKLIVDPGEKTVDKDTTTPVKLEGLFHGSLVNPETITLGELRRDEKGRLIFLGGEGKSYCVADKENPTPEIISEFDSIDWIDDICDGWVNVKVNLENTPAWNPKAKHKASVLSAPPKFAWGIRAPTTLFDIMEDIYWNKAGRSDPETVFYRDIWPVLSGTYALSWVNNEAFQGHGPGGKGNFLLLEDKLADPAGGNQERRDLQQQIFDRLREPNYNIEPESDGNDEQAITKFMPRLSGDNGDAMEPGGAYIRERPNTRFAALTGLQYKRFGKWRDGNFTKGSKSIPDFDAKIGLQPEYLTRANLEQTIGDPLYPGMEMWWIAKEKSIYDFSAIPKPAFRIDYVSGKMKPGHLSRGLSLPWQSDFDLCNTHWWPSIRPDDVVTRASFQPVADAATNGAKLLPASTKRKNWSRGLRTSPDGKIFAVDILTDMVKYWNYLGFVKKDKEIAKVTVDGTDVIHPLYLESERRQLPVPVVVAGQPIDN